MSEYKLSASLEGHEDDVRGVAFPSAKLVISASRDATVRLWRLISDMPPNFDGTVSSSGNAFVNTVTFIPPSKDFSEGLIAAGGKDTIIEVREPSKSPDQHAERLLVGHSNAVCSLDASQNGDWIISGSWDGTARIWSVGKWDCSATLEGHEGSVWGVLAYDKDTAITAAADKLIRIFRTDGKLVRKIRGHADVVRALCRLPPGHPSGADFASASNDGVIKMWKLDGSEVASLHGHESFIYSLAVLPSNELASVGEDRTLRIWKGTECVQTVTHPAISVWAVAVCQESGDIVTGASDKKARVFSRAAERQADPKAIEAFDESVKGSAIPQQQVGDINKEKLPGPEFLTQKMGKKDGQVTMIRENDGTVGAYSWSSASHEWVQVGTVVDSAGSSGRKQTYNGKDYDYVFDVDVEDGKPPLKLPYNLSQNPYEAATKFIQDNELSMNYLDEVANFITRNSQGASLGQSSGSSGGGAAAVAGADPWGQESRYRPGNDSSSTTTPRSLPQTRPKVLPQKSYLSIRTANLRMIQKKIEELNTTMENSSLDAKQLDTLRRLNAEIEKPAGSADLTESSVRPGLEILLSLLTTWQPANRLPALDLLRVLAGASPAVAQYTSASDGGNVIDTLNTSGALADKERPNNIMLAVRLLANLFETEAGRTLADTSFTLVNDLVRPTTQGTSNRNLSIAAATLYINYAVQTTAEDNRERVDTFDRASAAIETLTGILNSEKDSEATYRAIVGLGTWLSLGDEVKDAAKHVYNLESVLKKVEAQNREPRIKGVISEVRSLCS